MRFLAGLGVTISLVSFSPAYGQTGTTTLPSLSSYQTSGRTLYGTSGTTGCFGCHGTPNPLTANWSAGQTFAVLIHSELLSTFAGNSATIQADVTAVASSMSANASTATGSKDILSAYFATFFPLPDPPSSGSLAATVSTQTATVSFAGATTNTLPSVGYTAYATLTAPSNISSPAFVGSDSNVGQLGLSHTITGLTPNTSYYLTVYTITNTNLGDTSFPYDNTTSSYATKNVTTLPQAPVSVTATAIGAHGATVSFSLPVGQGSENMTYTVISNPAGGTDTNANSASLSHSITGLTSGVSYTFTVTATNAGGTGIASNPSTAVTPLPTPTLPTINTVVRGNAQATINFSTPQTLSGTLTNYTATAYSLVNSVWTAVAPPGSPFTSATPGANTISSITVTGLQNGTAYCFVVTYNNSTSSTSTPACTNPNPPNSVTPATRPGAPTIGSTVPNNAYTAVAFTPPTNTGGDAITSYTVTAYAAGVATNLTATGSVSPITIRNLNNGTAYTFVVFATNSIGTGPISAQSGSPVTPQPAPVAANSSTTLQINSTSNVITPSFTGTVNTPGIALTAAPTHGTATVSATGNTIAYTPASGFLGNDSLTYTITGFGGVSNPGTISLKVAPNATTASNASMQVPYNTMTTLDLLKSITGTNITGISISTQPAHGTVAVNGTKVSYTPQLSYFGTDSFAYLVYGAGGISPTAGIVSVSIAGHTDPTKDARVTGIVNTQTAAVNHFGTVQVFNFQQRMESRHHPVISAPAVTPSGNGSPTVPATNTPTPAPGEVPAANTPAPEPAPASSSLPGQNFSNFNSWKPNSVYSQTNDPNTMLHAMDTSNTGKPADPITSLVMNLATSLATSSTLNLATISNAAGQDNAYGKLDIWVAGNLRFGTSTQGGVDTRFATDGVTIGADKLITRKTTAGMGMGYAVDNSSIGTDGTYSRSTGVSFAGYGSYQMDAGTFLDGMLGYGKVNFDSNRYVNTVNDFARASRLGDQIFGSLSFGYDYRDDGLMLSPYGRYDFSYDRLDSGAESGAGTNALSYANQKMRTTSLSLGVRSQSSHQTDFGLVQPHARIELQHSIEVIGDTAVAYLDTLGTQYGVAGTTQSMNSVVYGLGSDFVFNDSLKFAIDYQRLNSPGTESYQALNFRLTKTLNGKNDFDSLLEDSYTADITKPTGLMVSAGYSYDNNVTRASDSQDIRSDSMYIFSASKVASYTLSKFTRFKVSGFLDTDQFRTYTGLSHISGGGEAEFMYRVSGDFGSPTFGIFDRFTDDAYESTLRDGTRNSEGVTLRKPLTDRINLFAALAENVRQSNSQVFNTRDVSARMNLDYQIDMSQAFYITGEYRKGDIVSSGQPSLQVVDMSTVFVRDDAFTATPFYDYRMKGKTVLLTLGYNLSVGPKDSVDLSWRGVKSNPDSTPAFAPPTSYSDSQYSAVYLMVF